MVERKPTRNIDLLFFKYTAYYDENDVYVEHWGFDWFWAMIVGVVLIGLSVI